MSQRRVWPPGVGTLAAAFALVAVLVQAGVAEVLGVYFGPRQSIAKPLIALYDQAQRSIHVAVYVLTLDPYAGALIRAHRRGVEVKVVLDKRQARHPASDARRLEAAGIPVRYGAGSGL
ncbi:MAG: phospholipase D-like domain-containing protein, partial [Candidatus Tectimicrobiota bacterium]